MKPILLLFISFLITSNIYAQESTSDSFGFKFNQDEFINQSVIDMVGSNDSIYNDIRKNIIGRFINPDYVLMVEEKPNLLRYQGISPTIHVWKSMGMAFNYKIKYVVDVEIKDKRIRVTFLNTELFIDSPNNSNSSDLASVRKNFWKRNGELRNMYSGLPQAIENFLNDEASFIKYSKQTSNESSDW
jgi:hypothetical protein